LFCPIRIYLTLCREEIGLAEQLEILIKGCRKGDSASQEKLYRQFSAAMFGLCMQYAASAEDAEDILQDGFVKVFKKLDQVKENLTFREPERYYKRRLRKYMVKLS
jgi:hypothetical protein